MSHNPETYEPEEFPGPRWQRRPTERRAEILEAAQEVFGDEGFSRATLASVARRAGVSAGTVSHYFGSKAELFEAMVADQALTDISMDETLILEFQGSKRELLHELMRRMWKRLNAPGKPELVLVVLGEMQAFPQSAQLLFRQKFERSRRVLAAVLEAGQKAGEFAVVDPKATAHLLAATVLGTTLDLHFLGQCCADGSCSDEVMPVLLDAVDRIVGPAAPRQTC
jgi:AcrR family transcriptional regulator